MIMQACSDDGFEEFREWLVGRGKEAYENALKDPETLVGVLEPGEQIFPTLLGPAMDAYERVTGKEMPPMPGERAQLQGRPTINIDADDAELLAEISARFPKLTAKFWEWWTRDKIYLEIRDTLRKVMVPLGFSESEIKSLGVTEFLRGQFRVEIRIEDVDLFYALFVSNELSNEGYPRRQPIMIFYVDEYDEAKKNAIADTIQKWLESIKL